MKRSLWLRIIHCGDWCLRLALSTPCGACHTWRRRRRLLYCDSTFKKLSSGCSKHLRVSTASSIVRDDTIELFVARNSYVLCILKLLTWSEDNIWLERNIVYSCDDINTTALPTDYHNTAKRLHIAYWSPVAYLECAKGGGPGVWGTKSPRSWRFFVNECLNFDVLDEKS